MKPDLLNVSRDLGLDLPREVATPCTAPRLFFKARLNCRFPNVKSQLPTMTLLETGEQLL